MPREKTKNSFAFDCESAHEQLWGWKTISSISTMFSDALGRSLEKRELDLSKVRQDMSLYISAHHDKRENKSLSLWTGKKTASETSSPITCCICNRHIYANNPFLSLSHEYLLCQCCMLNNAVCTQLFMKSAVYFCSRLP